MGKRDLLEALSPKLSRKRKIFTQYIFLTRVRGSPEATLLPI